MFTRAAVLVVVLLATLVAYWLLLPGSGELSEGAPVFPSATERTSVDVAGPALEFERVDATAVTEREPAAGSIDERARFDAPALVRVRLAAEPGAELDVAGWTVEVGVRAPDGNVGVRSARADAGGRLELAYDRPGEVDWVACTPPPDSGCAVALEQPGWELDPQEPLELEVALRRSGGWLEGDVFDRDGRGVGGVRVHAFAGLGPLSLERWEPSPIVATTDGSGRFRFPRLSAGEWVVEVEPGDWLQLEPQLGDARRGRNEFRLQDGGRRGSARLRVERAAACVVRVVDADGRPIESASVRLAPERLLGGRMRPYPSDDDDSLAALLAPPVPEVELDAPVFPYGELCWSTDPRGEARLVVVPGTWRLAVRGPFAGLLLDEHAVEFELELPGPDRTVVLGSDFLSLRVRLVDERGEPVRGRPLRVALRGDENRLGTAYTDGWGRCEIPRLEPDIAYDLVVENLVFIDMRVPLEAPRADGGEQVVVLREGLRPSVRAVDPSGEPLAGLAFRVTAVRPALVRADESLQLEGSEDWVDLCSNRDGIVPVPELPRGEYDLGLVQTFAQGGVDEHGYAAQVDPSGRPLTVARVVHSWTLPATTDEQVLEVAVPARAEPRAPPRPQHTGVVRDSASGTPLPGAALFIVREGITLQELCDVEGRFDVTGLIGPCDISVRAEGHLPLDLPTQSWPAGTQRHDFVLEPGGSVVDLVLLDAAGAALPTVRLRAFDDSGRALPIGRHFNPDVMYWSMEFRAEGGRIRAEGFPPGRVTLEARVESVALGTCSFVLQAQAGPQQATLRLSRTLDEVRAEVLGLSDPGPDDE